MTATKRRALQRQRSLARKQCFLHPTCLRIFHLTGLKRLVRILSGHHSRDPLLICRIKAAMASMVLPEKESWKCMRCRKVNKFSADYCPKRSRPWQEVIDRHFVGPRNAPPKSPRRQKAMHMLQTGPTKSLGTTSSGKDPLENVHNHPDRGTSGLHPNVRKAEDEEGARVTLKIRAKGRATSNPSFRMLGAISPLSPCGCQGFFLDANDPNGSNQYCSFATTSGWTYSGSSRNENEGVVLPIGQETRPTDTRHSSQDARDESRGSAGGEEAHAQCCRPPQRCQAGTRRCTSSTMIHSSWIAFLNASMQQWKEFADQVAAQERVAVERIATAQLAYQKACGLLNQEKQKIGIAPTAEVTTVSDEEQDATEIHSDGEWQPDHRRHAASEFNPSFPPFVSRSSCGTGTRSQTATHRGTARCRGCPNGFRKAQKYCYAAFWWGKLGATIWCPIAVPDAMAPTAPVQVQPWLHSIIDDGITSPLGLLRLKH